uniref:MOB kinase activator-like 3 n=1 Tax=Cacopsylla melanoneura TaxID=428564 RepID=A0A8D8Y3L2_9HEMI
MWLTFSIELILFTELYLNFAWKNPVPPCVEDHAMNICGLMEPSTKNQLHCLHLNIFLFLWIGLKAKSMMNICFLFQQEPHVNTCYKHFYYFIREFDLVNVKELEPLREMTAQICRDMSPAANH